jgi:hypothetical protein
MADFTSGWTELLTTNRRICAPRLFHSSPRSHHGSRGGRVCNTRLGRVTRLWLRFSFSNANGQRAQHRLRSLVRAGLPERVAMRISGHKTRDVFERYNITSTRDIEDAAKKLEAYHAQNGDNSATTPAPQQPAAPAVRPN